MNPQLVNYNGQLINLNGGVIANKFPIRDGLVFYLDGGVDKCYAGTGTTATDLSVSSVSTSLNNGVVFSEDNKGYFSFDGVNDYMRTSGGAVSMGHTQQRTTCAWIRLDDYNSSWKAIAEHTINFNSNNGGFLLDHSEFGVDGSLQQSIRGSIGYNIAWTDDPYDSNTWYFWCATYDASLGGLDCQQHYINGEQVDFTHHGSHNKNLNEYGRDNEDLYFNSRAGSNNFSNHDLGAFYLYDRVLSQDEIGAIYNHQKQRFEHIITDGLVLDLDATNLFSYPGTGTTWSDLSPSGNDATLINGPTFQSDPPALVFDGINDYGKVDNALNNFTDGTEPFSIEVWVSGTTQPSNDWAYIVHNSSGQTVGTSFVTIGISNAGKYFACIFGQWQQMATSVDKGNLVHIVLTYDGALNQKVYVNNSFENSYDQSGLGYGSDTTTSLGGTYLNGVYRPLQGKIYETRVYDRALTADEIEYNFNARRGRYGI